MSVKVGSQQATHNHFHHYKVAHTYSPQPYDNGDTKCTALAASHRDGVVTFMRD